ncbi:MAG: Na(+)/H(+) antiporter subunit B [Deltaproteobacteria bacterium HGW-Deltaproteobacteria-4]|nr:MAG: Na(+)/H(+) antiporter subunit B [Deltaproteobacteria bacterium HGW-Deltaproteobacteria-4]
MSSIILSTTIRLLLPLLLLFSVFLLLRGHNEPGGGFVGGLVAAAAISLYALAEGVEAARRILIVNPRNLIAGGLLTALGSGVIPLFFGRPFQSGLWLPHSLPVFGHVGTPLLFDLGVYLLVQGMALLIVLSLMEEE